MPLELGIYLGARKYGSSPHDGKRCLVLDRQPYRYQKFCSDIAGQDIRSHDNRVRTLVCVVRNWLRQWIREPGARIPGGDVVHQRYQGFKRALPIMCATQQLDLETSRSSTTRN